MVEHLQGTKSPRDYARRSGWASNTILAVCREVPGVARRIEDPTRTYGFRYEIIDPDLLLRVLASKPPHPNRPRPPAAEPPPGAAGGGDGTP